MSFEDTARALEMHLPAHQKWVYAMLNHRMNSVTRRCDPSVGRLSKDVGISKSAVKVALRELKEAKLITPISRFDGTTNLSNAYIIHLGIGQDPTPNKETKQRRESRTVPAKRVADPRHALFKQELSDYWLAKNGDAMPWGAADAKQLSNLLTSAPAMAVEQFQGCLKNRLDSESVNHAETPRLWLGKLLSYAAGPLDRFNRPKGDNTNGTFDAKSSYTADSAKTYIEQGRNSNAIDAFSHSETGEIGRRRLPSVC